MINFACLAPHPPIIAPEVGGEETKKLKPTIKALEKLSGKLADKDPRTLILITPHGPFHPEKINIAGSPKFRGNLLDFGAEVEFEFENDQKLANKINKQATKAGIPTTIYRSTQEYARLDHGVIIPLYYLLNDIGSINIVTITYSQIDRSYHFALGEIIGELAKSLNYDIGIIASGDLSHRLADKNSPNAQIGKEYDQMIRDYLNQKDLNSIVKIEPEIIERAGECAYRSLLILLGAISYQNWQAEVLSYQAPFGVGYSVVDFNLKNKADQNE
jgi:aromatic ring-opening dioxygenase LigB subunit